MARPRSERKRRAILGAATRVIASQGLSAPTTIIAREAGVAHGSMFTYFETKAELWNELYLDLRSGMAAAALKRYLPDGERRRQFEAIWWDWMDWGVAHAEERRALAVLGVSDEVTPESRAAGDRAMAGMGELVARIHANGPMSGAPRGLCLALMNSVAEATMDFMARGQGDRVHCCRAGFEAVWRMVG